MNHCPRPAPSEPLRPTPAALVLALCPRVDLQPLPQVVRKLVRLFDGRRTLDEVCARAQISVERGEALVRKLSLAGILETVSDTEIGTSVSQLERAETLRGMPPLRTSCPARLPAAHPGPGFSAAEEAFFASEVRPIDECDEPFSSVGEKLSLFVSDLVLRLRGGTAL